MDVIWRGPLTDPSGYASEGRAFVRGLIEEGARVRIEPDIWSNRKALTPGEMEVLADLTVTPVSARAVSVQHTFGRSFDPYAPGSARIGRTMFETDRIPDDWVVRCNQMDEVWVPTPHNRDAFTASGVEADRLVVVPGPFELDRLDPNAEPLDIPEAHGTVFLAAFDWTLRKGWDVLIDAWCEAFRDGDDVTLVLKTWSTSRGLSLAEIEAEAAGRIAATGHDPAAIADIVILDSLLPACKVASLYRAADVVVAPTRGEGWCRPLVEAMAMGRPVIATGWSGPAAFVDDTVGWSLPFSLADVSEEASDEVPTFRGHRWAEPDRPSLVAALREAHDDPAARRARGESARVRAQAFDHRTVARQALARLAGVTPRPAARRRPDRGRPGVLLEGSFLREHSLAGVNRELARALMGSDRVDVGLLDLQGISLDTSAPEMAPLVAAMTDLLPGAPEVTVRHSSPPSFVVPASGKLVVFMHWEFGTFPADWSGLARERADEVWVASRYVRDWAIRSGLDGGRVAVIPLGVDPARFSPFAPPVELGETAPGFRFLFVGGLLWRKGADTLLDAYVQAFTRDDDVTLVLKDFGRMGPYPEQAAEKRARELVADPAAPRIAHWTGALEESQMPGLYTACDCLVHPYRGEAYGLTIVEAMACGLPVIIPEGGPSADYADPSTAFLVPSREAQVTGLDLGMRQPQAPVVLDTGADDLAAAMRRVYEDRVAARRVGARASAHIRANHTWAHTGDVVEERLIALAEPRRTAA